MNGTGKPQSPAPAPLPSGSGGGGCGKGCAMILVLLGFFLLAFFGGAFWTARHYGQKYTEAEPATMPDDLTSDEPASVGGAAPSAPSYAPTPSPREVEKQWKQFDRAADRGEKARIELTAAQINALLQANRNTRGRVFVTIGADSARVRFSVPLNDVPLVKGRYVNGEATVKSSPDGDPAKAQIIDVVLAKQAVSDAIVDRKVFSWPSLREVCMDWMNKQKIETFRIENGKAISETRGQ